MSLFGNIENNDEALKALRHADYLINKADPGSIAHEKPVILNELKRINKWLASQKKLKKQTKNPLKGMHITLKPVKK